MKHALIITGLLIALFASPLVLAQDEPAFIDGFGDIPLLDGFAEDADGRMVFDAPSGTISQTRLFSDLELAQARAVYRDALKGLGWMLQQENTGKRDSFDRAGMRLTLEYSQSESVVLVQVQMAPGNGGQAAGNQ